MNRRRKLISWQLRHTIIIIFDQNISSEGKNECTGVFLPLGSYQNSFRTTGLRDVNKLGVIRNISHIIYLVLYQCMCLQGTQTISITLCKQVHLGNFMGPSFDISEAMYFVILTDTDSVIHITLVVPLYIGKFNSYGIK